MEEIFDLELKIAKLQACCSSLNEFTDNSLDDLVEERKEKILKNEKNQKRNNIIFWIVYFILFFLKLIVAFDDAIYSIMFWTNYFLFIGAFGLSIIKERKIKKDCYQEKEAILLSGSKLYRTLNSLIFSLKIKKNYLINHLNNEENYYKYLEEYKEQIEESSNKKYDNYESVLQTILEVTEDMANNINDDYQEYKTSIREYFDYISEITENYFLKQMYQELENNNQDLVEEIFDVIKLSYPEFERNKEELLQRKLKG